MKQRPRIPCVTGSYFVLASLFTFNGFSAREARTEPAKSSSENVAIQRSLDLLEKSAQQWKASCVSCHHQALQLVTADAARRRGFQMNESFLHYQQVRIQDELAKSQSRMQEVARSTSDQPQLVGPNPDMVFGYSLFGLAQTQVQPSPLTDNVVRYLLLLQDSQGGWKSCVKQRPPFEASDFAATALMVRVIQKYAPFGGTAEVQPAVARAATWLTSNNPSDTEDQAFRLFGLRWAGAIGHTIKDAGRDLLVQQRSDGGWAQTPALTSDAYATGESLLALRTAGIVDSSNLQFRRGIEFLLRTQQPDGSWYVKSRAQPIQQYFDTGFPYATDQFISYAATCWATLAMLSDDTSKDGALH